MVLNMDELSLYVKAKVFTCHSKDITVLEVKVPELPIGDVANDCKEWRDFKEETYFNSLKFKDDALDLALRAIEIAYLQLPDTMTHKVKCNFIEEEIMETITSDVIAKTPSVEHVEVACSNTLLHDFDLTVNKTENDEITGVQLHVKNRELFSTSTRAGSDVGKQKKVLQSAMRSELHRDDIHETYCRRIPPLILSLLSSDEYLHPKLLKLERIKTCSCVWGIKKFTLSFHSWWTSSYYYRDFGFNPMEKRYYAPMMLLPIEEKLRAFLWLKKVRDGSWIIPRGTPNWEKWKRLAVGLF